MPEPPTLDYRSPAVADDRGGPSAGMEGVDGFAYFVAWCGRIVSAVYVVSYIALGSWPETASNGVLPMIWILSGLASLLTLGLAGLALLFGCGWAIGGTNAGSRFWRYAVEACLSSGAAAATFWLTAGSVHC